MSISYTLYDPSIHQEKFHQFVKETYGERSFLLDPKYVKWWFCSSPFRNKNNPSDIVICLYNDMIIGMDAHIGGSLIYKGKPFNMHWIVNTMLHQKYRRGIGLNLMSETGKRFGNAATISYNDLSGPVLKHLGYTTFNDQTLGRAIRVTDPARFKELSDIDLNMPGSSIDYKGEFSDMGSASDLKEAEELFQGVAKRYGLTTNRTAEYFQWRFVQHPVGGYQFRGYKEGGRLSAFAVIRKDGKGPTAMRIVDLFGEKNSIAPLLDHLAKQAAEENCVFIDFYGTSMDASAFGEAGYSWLSEEDKAKVPFLFNPLAGNRPFTETVGFKFPDNPEAMIGSMDELYFTKADGDRDRPQ